MGMPSSSVWDVIPVVTFLTGLKLACFPLYRSTDFEVHRNWMAVTHSLPVGKWYVDSTSEWTLDYPPFFAWFEYALSFVARMCDPRMLEVKNLNYASWETVYFMRATVIVSDLVFAGAAWLTATSVVPGVASNRKLLLVLAFSLLFGDVNLFMVDHLHFQYNGLLNGILFLSIACIIRGRNSLAAFLFAVLLNFKHIYLYIAPVFFFYLLRAECFRAPQPDPSTKQKGKKGNSGDGGVKGVAAFRVFDFLRLGAIVAAVFAASLGPFLLMGQMSRLRERLFPFKRGLTHAYWAPNFWAVYNGVDKALAWKFGSDVVVGGAAGNETLRLATSTSGRVEEFDHVILPSITPLVTLLVTAPFTVLSSLPVLVRPTWEKFLESLVLCAWSSFLFGWHVHEKAILMVTLPLCVLALRDSNAAWIYYILQCTATLSLFPLLFTPMENVLKPFLWIASAAGTYSVLQRFHEWKSKCRTESTSAFGRFAAFMEYSYLLGLVFVYVYYAILHGFVFGKKLEFLPLLAVSMYCAFGVMYCWLKFLAYSLF